MQHFIFQISGSFTFLMVISMHTGGRADKKYMKEKNLKRIIGHINSEAWLKNVWGYSENVPDAISKTAHQR